MAFFSRGKYKIPNPYVTKDFYKAYINSVEANTPYVVDYKTYVYIVETYYKELVKYILGGGVYKLPYKMGDLLIVKYRPRKRTATNTPIDWFNTVKYGKLIRHTNDHSNYFKFLINWNKAACRVANKTLYRFVPTRDFKRTLAAKIKQGDTDYFEL